MLAQQRQTAILDLVRRHGGVRVSHLVRQFGVSDMTIRRDLEALAERGLVDKVHGGATVAGPGSTEEPGFDAKSVRQRTEKSAIAARAAELVEPGTAVALSAGTTTAALAGMLLDVPGLTVVTNSVPVADALYHSGRPDQTVVLTGGIRTPSDALAGPVAEAAIASLNVDVLFLGVHGMSPRTGFTTPNLMEAGTNRLLVAAARRLVVAGRPHQVGDRRHRHRSRRWRTPTCSITDAGLPAEARAQLSEHVGDLIVVDPIGERAGVKRTVTHLADGRELIYFDEGDDGRPRPSRPPRPAAAPPPASEIRYDPLLDEWVAIATHRQTRTYLPPTDECPLCPSTPAAAHRDPRVRLRRGGLREPVPVVQPTAPADRPAAPARADRHPARVRAVRGGLLHLRPRRVVRRR